jgi:hypothetical protein
MQIDASEKTLSKLLAYGSALTTVFLISGSVSDPVNAPKLLIAGALASSAAGLILSSNLRTRLLTHRRGLIPVILFIASMILAVIFSKSPLSQNMYGSYGRNNGFLAYIFMAGILCSGLVLRQRESFHHLAKALIFAGYINLIYCGWVIAFGDFIGWSNPYGNILGTLGNPNFIGAFLGIFIGAYLAFGVSGDSGRLYKLSMIVVLPTAAIEIIQSHAIQGRVVAVLCTGIVGFFYLRSKRSSLIVIAYSVFCLIAGGFALAGALQIGPLTSFIYKTSVSLRGQYWLAGWNTGNSHPLTGVGMDAFGDWYRRSRSSHAIELPGINTVVNAAHNVWMDMFAFGGWPLLLAYLAILALTLISIVKVTLRKKDYDPVFVALTSAWIGYQVQSIISINQIGLAVWGWALSGALIAYEASTRDPIAVPNRLTSERKRAKTAQHPLAPMIGLLSGLVGMLIALPPLTADAEWRSAQLVSTVPAIEATMQGSYFNPQNSTKYLNNIQSLEASSLFELSHKYALEAVKWNSESFELWKVLYLVKNSTEDEKSTALSNMKRLDPLNPDVTSIK